jgi:hypothetical protein
VGRRVPSGGWRDASLVDRPFKLAVIHIDNAKTVEKIECQYIRFWSVQHLTGITPGEFRWSPGRSPVSLATCPGNLPGFDDAAAKPHPTPLAPPAALPPGAPMHTGFYGFETGRV